ncbi:hypothetical protein [Mesorhizobium sp.]|uniref:hypothetical protein n=1 Tax=Mesorhizobium sp. TaxID=1871066 RepID=UPI000FE5E3C4|nr:hypothetical protein [Mesorhizobium sp.]RWI87941.1 MAG: hypothetical protein EOR21_27785 [Mesorhizobium sp.]
MDKCEECKVQYLNVPVTDWATHMKSTVQAALLRDPSINYILPIYDGMAQSIVPAVELTQSADRVKIATSTAAPMCCSSFSKAASRRIWRKHRLG